jgi:hypothetical protein
LFFRIRHKIRGDRTVVDKEYKTEAEAARFLGKKPSTLATWRARRKGPAYYKNGATVLYTMTDLREYVRTRRVVPGACKAEREAPAI